MKCPTCGQAAPGVYKCDSCGDVICTSTRANSCHKMGKKGIYGGSCSACKKGKYKIRLG
jgi:hypothetical protein